MKIIYILIFIVFGCQLRAQKTLSSSSYELSWSDELKASTESGFSYIFKVYEDKVITFSRNKKVIDVCIFDNDNALLQTSKLIYQSNSDEKRELFWINQMNDDFWVYYKTKYNNKKTEKLFVQKLELEKMILSGDPILLSTIEHDFKNKVSSRHKIAVSNDLSKILIIADNTPYRLNIEGMISSDSLNIELLCFSSSFKKIWSKDLNIPYKRKFFHLYDFTLDNFGNAHLVGEKYKIGIKRRLNGKSNYYFKLWSLFDDGNRIVTNKISLNDRFIKNFSLEFDSKNNLIIMGLYSDETSYTSKGLYYLKYANNTALTLQDTIINFETEFITRNQFRTANIKKEEQLKELFKFNIHHLLVDSNDYIKIIAEQDFENSFVRQGTRRFGTFSGQNFSYSPTSFKNNNIIVLKIHPDGKIIWSETIGKRQVSSNDGGKFCSYVLHQDKDDLYFVYNDNLKNYKSDKDYFLNFSFGKNGIVTMTKLNDEGLQSKVPLCYIKDHKLLIKPKYRLSIPGEKLILISHEGKKYKIGQMIIKD